MCLKVGYSTNFASQIKIFSMTSHRLSVTLPSSSFSGVMNGTYCHRYGLMPESSNDVDKPLSVHLRTVFLFISMSTDPVHSTLETKPNVLLPQRNAELRCGSSEPGQGASGTTGCYRNNQCAQLHTTPG